MAKIAIIDYRAGNLTSVKKALDKVSAGAIVTSDPNVVATADKIVLPGVGQIYNGDFLRGIFWLIITPGFWIGTGGLLGWVCHLIAAYTAHNRAEKKARGEL